MGDYDPRRLFKQEPAAITTVINLWLALAVVAEWIPWSAEIIAGFIAALNATLLLLYIRPSTVTKDGLRELEGG
jgi:hypothetical protein